MAPPATNTDAHSTRARKTAYVLRVPPPADTPPPRLPDYELLRLIGRGSYGDVWLARAVTGVFRAVKIIWRERFPDERPYVREFEGVTRFAAISLREPSQLALLHAGRSETEGFFYYVMELADDAEHGRTIEPETYVPLTLRELHRRHVRIHPAEVVALGAALSRGLATLHRAGLVHRDIKPSNVVLIGGVPKLADIGLVAAASAGLTFVGTEGFVPPEGPGAPAADVYSLGKVLYELATGLDRHDWPRLPPDLAELPDRRALLELNEVLVRACEPDARKRFLDAGALLDELLLLQAGKSIRRLRTAERRTARALRAAAVFAVVAAVAGSGAWIEHQRAAQETERRRTAEVDRDALRQRTVYAAQLAQAQRAIEQNDFGRARRLLVEATPSPGEPDLRGFEWHALLQLAQGDPCDVIRDGGPAIDFVTVSPDGATLAVHDEDRKVVLYDAATLQERFVLPGVQRLAGFSSDGNWLLGTNVRSGLQRWRTADGSADPEVRGGASYRPLGAQGTHRVIAWANPRAADATRGTPAKPGALIVWDFASASEVFHLPMESADDTAPWEYFRSAVSPSGEEIAVVFGQGRGTALRYQLTHANLGSAGVISHQTLENFLPNALGVLPDDRGRGTWWVAEPASGRQLRFSTSSRQWESTTQTLPIGISHQVRSRLGGDDILLQAHHAHVSLRRRSEENPCLLQGHGTLITSMAALPQGTFITASAAGELRRWSMATSQHGGPQRQCWNSHGAGSETMFSPDGDVIYAPLDGAAVVALDAATLEPRETIPGIRRLIGRTSQVLWGISADGSAVVGWNLDQRRFETEIGRSATVIVNATLAPDGKRLCFTRASGELCTATLGSNVLQSVPGAHEYLWSLTFDSTGTRLWSVGRTRRLECRRIPQGSLLWSVEMPAVTASLCAIPKANLLAVALENGDVQLHDADSGRAVQTIASGSSAIQSLAVTPDNRRIIGGGAEGDLHVIDVSSRTYFAAIPLNAAVGPIHNVMLSEDGSSVAVLGKSGMLRVLATHPPNPSVIR